MSIKPMYDSNHVKIPLSVEKWIRKQDYFRRESKKRKVEHDEVEMRELVSEMVYEAEDELAERGILSEEEGKFWEEHIKEDNPYTIMIFEREDTIDNKKLRTIIWRQGDHPDYFVFSSLMYLKQKGDKKCKKF